MSCPTCSHTMCKVGENSSISCFWCPRCGTIFSPGVNGEPDEIEAPNLVERCRKFNALYRRGKFREATRGAILLHLQQLGITEAINKPEDRK